MKLKFAQARPGLTLLILFSLARCAGGQEFPNLPALTPAELAMTDNPKQPGAPAVILYYAIDTDNQKSMETYSMRIKVFRDEGKKYADVEIPYLERYALVDEIHARTIGKDGKITPFEQEVFDRELVKIKKFGYRAKVFTLPNVQEGSVLEYTYCMHYKEKVPDAFQHPDKYLFSRGITYPAAEWDVQGSLFLIHGRFSLRPVKGVRVERFATGLSDAPLPQDADGRMQLDVENLSGFDPEEFAPPETVLKAKMNLYYAAGFYWPDAYWSGLGEERSKEYEKFIGLKRSKSIDAEVARLVAPGDSDEMKLRKLYDSVQQIRALSFEDSKTDKELKRQNLKENRSAQDVLEHRYAAANEINLFFIAMARSAGFIAHPVMVSSRRDGLFQENYPNPNQLNAMVVKVQTSANTYFLDPATLYCPFGLLPWSETAAGGITLDSSSYHVGFTPNPQSRDAVTRYQGNLQLDATGTLKGVFKVQYEGQEALIQRLWASKTDAAKRAEDLEAGFKTRFSDGAIVKLKSSDGWEKTEVPLTVEYEVELPNYAAPAGRRLVFPLGVLHNTEKNPFPSPRRVYPIYFEYPYEVYEDIHIELPPGIQIGGLPPEKKAERGVVKYYFSVKKDGENLEIKRTKLVQAVLMGVDQYPALRAYFDQVLAGDSQQVTLKQIEVAEIKPNP
jgi:Domain of Unknown Function with PDB structure (DUF3857)